jgi:hypothetical protein
MFQNLGSDWSTRLDRMDGAPMPRYGGFGERNANKSTKAVIGVAILIVLSIVLYELRANRIIHTSSATPAITQMMPAAV